MSFPLTRWTVQIPTFAVIGLVLLGLPGTCATASDAIKNVLVIHEGGIQMPVNILATRGLEQALGGDRGMSIHIFHEYLDDWRLTPDTRQIAETYRQKYWRERRPDVIVAMGTSPVRLMVNYGTTHFDGTPVVFLLNSDRFIAPDSLPPNMTGVSGHFDFVGTIELALRLHPGTRQVFFVGGRSKIEQRYKDIFQKETGPLLRGIEVTYLDGLPFGELLSRLAELPEHSLVYCLFLVSKDKDTGYTAPEVSSLAVMASNAPVYTSHPPLFGSGVVGGSFFTIDRDARLAAGMVLRILKGERPQNIPREYTRFSTAVDWRQLQRWHIPESRLAPGTSVLFRVPTVWELYKLRIISVIAICVLQTILIGGLLMERKRRRKSTEALGKAEGARQESEQRFRNMADTAPVMIWVSGTDKLCTFFNKVWLEFTGRTMEQELGEGWAKGVHPDDIDRCITTYSTSFDARRSFQMKYRIRRKDGEYRWVLDDGVPRFTPSGSFAGYIGSCVDITEIKRAQEEALAAQKLESVGELARGIAHDFNNLLGGILATTELALADRAEGSFPEEELQTTRIAAIRGGEIVRQLMTYAGEGSPAFEPIDLSLLVHEILQLLKVSISKHAILETELAEGLPAVHGNPAQIRQVVMNLVTNASEAIGDRAGVIRVITARVRVGPDTSVTGAANLPPGDYLKLEVSDTGSGMTPAVQTRIFDPFFTTKSTGHGLGLAAVQGIVRGHYGAVNVVSSLGQGTRFEVLLPSTDQPVQPIPNIMAQASAGEGARVTGTILVVEDEGTLRLAISKMLRKKGLSVIEAVDGSAALDFFRANESNIAVVLLDITLPGMGGPEVLAELRRIRPDVKVILTTAYGQETTLASVGGQQAWAFIRKPYQLNDLWKLIWAACRQKGMSAHAASARPAS
jgi:PAS domain S-box-containing protein